MRSIDPSPFTAILHLVVPSQSEPAEVARQDAKRDLFHLRWMKDEAIL